MIRRPRDPPAGRRSESHHVSRRAYLPSIRNRAPAGPREYLIAYTDTLDRHVAAASRDQRPSGEAVIISLDGLVFTR